jgi:hypothetical protein
VTCLVPTSLDKGRRSPRKLLRAVVARLLGRKLQRPLRAGTPAVRHWLVSRSPTAAGSSEGEPLGSPSRPILTGAS